MAGTKRTRAIGKAAPVSNEYVSDDFVASDSDAPVSKKTKTTKSTTKDAAPKSTSSVSKEVFHDLSTGKSPRRVNVSEFKGKQLVNIREYYEKDGELLPGKKVPNQANLTDLLPQLEMLRDALQGISLTTEQFQELLRALPDIKRALDLEEGGEQNQPAEKEKAKENVDDDDLVLTEKEKAEVRLQRKHPHTFAVQHRGKVYFIDDAVQEQFNEWEDGLGEFIKHYRKNDAVAEYDGKGDGPLRLYEAVINRDIDSGGEDREGGDDKGKPQKAAPKSKAVSKAKTKKTTTMTANNEDEFIMKVSKKEDHTGTKPLEYVPDRFQR